MEHGNHGLDSDKKPQKSSFPALTFKFLHLGMFRNFKAG